MKSAYRISLVRSILHGATAIALAVVPFCASCVFAAEADKPEIKEWKKYPIPYGEPKTPRPPNAEFLKLLPQQRTAPEFSAASHDRGFAVWWGDPGVHIFSEQPPTREEIARQMALQTSAGDDEAVVLGLWGLHDMEGVSLVVKNSPFPIVIRHVEFRARYVPGDDGGDHVPGGRTVGFATYLPVQNTARIIKGQNTVFWLTVATPADAKPGIYMAALQLKDSREKTVDIPLTINVLDYTLPAADIAYGMYFRPVDDTFLAPQYRTPEMLRAYWRDMAKHGMTSATLYPCGPPLCDAQGNAKLAGNPDIETIKDMMKDGLVHKEIPIMWLGAMTVEAGPAVVAELKKQGLPELLVYGPDEPEVGNAAVKAHLESLKPLRKYFRIVTALSDHPAEVYSDYLDVWAVSCGRIHPKLQELATQKRAEMWTYQCVDRGMSNTTMSRFNAGLYSWALRLKGNFLWCYTDGYSWEGNKNACFCHVLPSLRGPVPSVQWEARREGIKDYRTMRLLESLIAAHPGSGKAKEAQAWVDQVRSRVDWYLARNMPPSMYAWDGPELYPLCPNFRPSELSDVRAKAAAYIQQLKKVQ
jgi:hypothetical protein